jgi:predicted ATP-grasp superfamily ATP-dependent carboligase
VGEARWRGDVVEQALALLSALGFRGIAQTEFRLDPRDERFKLMEVNPRLWQWHGLARACGVDLPRIAYFDVLGRPQSPVRSGPAHDGRRWVVAAAHLRASRQEGTPLRRALREMGPGAVEGTFDIRDPLPALVQAGGLVTAPIARALRRRRGVR